MIENDLETALYFSRCVFNNGIINVKVITYFFSQKVSFKRPLTCYRLIWQLR